MKTTSKMMVFIELIIVIFQLQKLNGVTVIPNQSPHKPYENGGRNNYSASNEDYNEQQSPREGASVFGDSQELAHNQSIGNSGIEEIQTPTESFGNLNLGLNRSYRKGEKSKMRNTIDKYHHARPVSRKSVLRTNSDLSVSVSEQISDAVLDQQSQGIPNVQTGGHRDQEQSANVINEGLMDVERYDTLPVEPFVDEVRNPNL